MVTGDVVSGFMWDGVTRPWYAPIYDKMFSMISEMGYNWTMTAGNHDSQGDLTRSEVHDLDMSYDMSLTRPNAGDLTHSFNYVVPVYNQDGTEILTRLWHLDTGDSDCMGVTGYDCAHPDQIKWFRDSNNAIADDDISKGHGFLFLHIPLIEYVHLYNDYNFFGHKGEDVCCWSVNTGLFGALKE